MNIQYVFIPKNPILWHCADSFFNVLSQRKSQQQDANTLVESIVQINVKSTWHLVHTLLNVPPDTSLALFLLALQPDYLVIAFLLKLVSKVWRKKLSIYYLMHEPRLEKGQVNFIKAFLVYAHQVMFAYIADKVMLPSDKAVDRAKTFVPPAKINQINLAFAAIPNETLKQSLQQLKGSWDDCKKFLMLGTVSSIDKNPQGFLNFASAFHCHHPNQAQFIRAGRDRTSFVEYDDNLIIRFPSYISEATKRFLLGLTHFVIVPYTASTQSGVITEALSHGKLIIVNDIPAFAHLKKFSFIFTVDFSDPKSILACIHEILAMDISEYEKRYWEAIHYFEQHYSERRLAAALNEVLS